MGWSSALTVLATLLPGQEPAADFYQDFRVGREPLPPLTLVGPDAAAVTRPEDGGLRITLPAKRKQLAAVGLQTKVELSGDFEITGSYELLSAEPPKKGYGVGVNLLIAPDSTMKKSAKVARYQRPREGNCYLADLTIKDPERDYRVECVPTEATSGHLRLVRKGSTLRYLVAEGAGNDFQQIYEQEFGGEDVTFVRFVVNSGNSPAAVDARLVDFKIRSASGSPISVAKEEGQSGALWGALAGGALLAVSVVTYFLLRRRKVVPSQAPGIARTNRP